jgi:glycosyltransferase involved in cell wall biosynthesis
MKILVLTSIYPSNDATKGTTPVVHYFCNEWVKLGHEVLVVHNDNKYLLFFYLLPKFIKNFITSKFGVILPNIAMRKTKLFKMDNVKVLRMPILKIIPFGKFSNYQLNRQLDKIKIFLEEEDFIPDVITGHWENPQIDLIFELKKCYTYAKTSVVIHVTKYIDNIDLRTKILSFDSIGFRNKTLLNKFIEDYKIKYSNLYTCYSGLPENFFESINYDFVGSKFEEEILSIVYVGLFLKRKYPESLVKAVYYVKNRVNIRIDYVGEGNEQRNVKKLVEKLNLSEKVKFHNRINRDEVKNILVDSQVFIMISEDEAFGLVYLEAMACGCIVVASRNEGFDGIIEDGFNGFLCKAGDEEELSKIILKINSLSIKNKKLISKNAIKTASKLTNKKVSENYLENILGLNRTN